MANIYEPKSEDLHFLIERASSGQGATVVIPDLQRPYVWHPNQVILLIDSLIRGWPFGTLLLWKVDSSQLTGIPHRQFWQVVDRTSRADGTTVPRLDPPASYHMVLDGQQRIQSLLLALGGDSWGFKQEDRDWTEQLDGIRARGRRAANPHWSKGTLCFDVDEFLRAYAVSEDVIGIDYRNVLKWAVTDPSNGRSSWRKPQNYREPLVSAFADGNVRRFLRLARLWNAVIANANLRERQFKEQIRPILEEHSFSVELIEQVLDPMGELMSVIRDVKLSKITYLELRPFDESVWTRDEYNEAIVNIFTRLNTAGRTLTREEITFAWLKAGWNNEATTGKTAGDCFEGLLTTAKENGLPIQMDDVVRAVSFIWAASYRQGLLLSDKDLLQGNTVSPMATDLSIVWEVVDESLRQTLNTIRERELKFGQNGQFNSLNSVTIIWCLQFLALRWLRSNSLNTLATDSYRKQIQERLDAFIDRWLICSQWAGRWATSSGTTAASYASDLAYDRIALDRTNDSRGAIEIIGDRLSALVKGVTNDAIQYVQSLCVEKREQVSRYNSLLWVWHRLNDERWAMSKIPLRAGRKSAYDVEVDHTVSINLWERMVTQLQLPSDQDSIELQEVVNLLGNCTLLEKTFNISKNDSSLKSFLAKVHEFKKNELSIEYWAEQMRISAPMLDPGSSTCEELKAAIEERDRIIRQEIMEFVNGNRVRVDIPASGATE
ncbi:MAG: DUF262 domain-containing protein [Planctomycetes bacterium]|nr:DUF262 domain-containing protein [Planctomycetota bacterium]